MIVLFYSLRVPGHETQLKCIRRRGFVCGDWGGGSVFARVFQSCSKHLGCRGGASSRQDLGDAGGHPSARPPPCFVRLLPAPSPCRRRKMRSQDLKQKAVLRRMEKGEAGGGGMGCGWGWRGGRSAGIGAAGLWGRPPIPPPSMCISLVFFVRARLAASGAPDKKSNQRRP